MMLDFFPFETKYYYKINMEQKECLKKLQDELSFLTKYQGKISDGGFEFKRKRSFFYRNGLSTIANGNFIKNGSQLFLIMTFSMDEFTKSFSIVFALVAFVISVIGIIQRDLEMSCFLLFFIFILIFGKIYTYLFEEQGFIQDIEYTLGVPERIDKVSDEIN